MLMVAHLFTELNIRLSITKYGNKMQLKKTTGLDEMFVPADSYLHDLGLPG